MKKSLLLASALLCAASSFAADMTIGPDADDVTRKTDPATYEKFGDYELKNRWMLSRNTDGNEVLEQYLPEKHKFRLLFWIQQFTLLVQIMALC